MGVRDPGGLEIAVRLGRSMQDLCTVDNQEIGTRRRVGDAREVQCNVNSV